MRAKHNGQYWVFKGNLNKSDLAKFIHILDTFTTEILKIWSEISYDSNITSTKNLQLVSKHSCSLAISI